MSTPEADRILAGATGNGIALPEVSLDAIVTALDTELRTAELPDYGGAVNGLQVANEGTVQRVAVAVDASHAAVNEAVMLGAQLLIVHHGLFWAGAQPLTGVRYRKWRTLLQRNVAVYASHLPLDLHPTLGNNARLAATLGLVPSGGFARHKTVDIGCLGTAQEPTADLVARVRALAVRYGGTVRTSVPVEGRTTTRWALCSGGGASSDTIAEALAKGVDTLIVGEGAHHTTVDAIEHDLCIVYAGHYATETLGVQALGGFLQERFGLPWTFLHLPTGS